MSLEPSPDTTGNSSTPLANAPPRSAGVINGHYTAAATNPATPGADQLAIARSLLTRSHASLSTLAAACDVLAAETARRTSETESAQRKVDGNLTREIDQKITAIADEEASETLRIESEFAAATAAANLKLAVQRGITDEEAGGVIGKARNEQKERVWVAETMFDSAKDRPRLDFELVRRELEPRLPQLNQLRLLAVQSVRFVGLSQLPEPKPAPPAPPPMDGTDDESLTKPTPDRGLPQPVIPLPPAALVAVERFNIANQSVQRLINLKLPRLYAMPWPIVVALAGFAIGAAGALWMDAWQFYIKTPIFGVVGAILTAAALFASKGIARRRVHASAQLASDEVSRAEQSLDQAISQASERRVRREKAVAHRRDREIKKAGQLSLQTEQATSVRRRTTLQQLTTEHQAAIAGATTKHVGERATLAQSIAAKRGELRIFTEMRTAATATAVAAARLQLATSVTEASAALQQQWTAWSASLQVERKAMTAAALAASPPWLGGPVISPKPRPALVVGHVRQRLDAVAVDRVNSTLNTGLNTSVDGAAPIAALELEYDLPVGLQTPLRGSLLIQAPADKRAEAVSLLQVATLRALLSLPAGKTRFVLIDPVGLGQSFAGMMHLADSNPQFVTDRIWTDTRHIEARLTDLTEHMETVIQKYLRNDFATIDDYNVFAGEVAEPYRFLVIADLPASFSESACAKLASIISSGPRCGVYTLIATDPRAKLPGSQSSAGQPPLSMADLERASLTLQYKSGRFVVKDEVLSKFDFTPLSPPPDDQFKALVQQAGQAAKEAAKVRVGFNMLLPAPGLEWTGDTTHELRIPLGRLGASKLQYLTLGKGTAQHVLTAGRTGSGKSTLLNVIITASAMWFSPDELELYLIDFKKGVEFRAYAAAKLPHARVIAIESEREFGLSVLRRLDEELQRRGQMFRDCGAQDLAAFRAASPQTVMPRCLLMIDEFQEFFSEDDRLAGEAGLLLDRLVRQGRAFGMHVILGSQTLAGAYSLARATIGQMAVRIALQCSEADSYLILSEDNAAARLLSRPGEAIYNDASGMLEGNSPFQVAWLPDEERSAKLALSRTLLGTKPPRRRPEPAVVFEGARPGKLEDNQLLSNLHAAFAAGKVVPAPLRLWLGDPLSIKEPTSVTFQRQSGSNLLVVSQRDDMATGMLAAGVTALLLQFPVVSALATAEFGGCKPLTIIDGTPADSSLAPALQTAALAAGAAAINADFVPYRDILPSIDKLEAELARRREQDATDAPPLVLLISQLQRFRTLRKGEEDFGMSFGDAAAAQTPDKKLVSIIRDGPNYNMHTILWCDTAGNVERTLPRGILKDFDLRVLTQMSSNDSGTLIDSPAASTLGQSRAVLFCESRGTAERFRPYAL